MTIDFTRDADTAKNGCHLLSSMILTILLTLPSAWVILRAELVRILRERAAPPSMPFRL